MTAGRRNSSSSTPRNEKTPALTAVNVGPCKVVDIRSGIPRTGLMFSHKPGRDRAVCSLSLWLSTSGGSGWRGGNGRHRSLFYGRLLEGGRKLRVVSFTRFARSPLNNLVIRKFENDSRETYGGFRKASRRKLLRKKKKKKGKRNAECCSRESTSERNLSRERILLTSAH